MATDPFEDRAGSAEEAETGEWNPAAEPPPVQISSGMLPPGTTVGRYLLLELLGTGGFGAVYKAEQREPIRRTVAVKLIKPGIDTAEVIARFESERQALARMDHPNIARVLDAGTTPEGRPFFVMEYVPGKPVTTYADENRLSIRDRLELFCQVCRAIAHAHTKAILHRDIKASNVLAHTADGQPAAKVIDFGVAKALSDDRLTDRTLNTRQGMPIGTYEAMSPEQVEGSPDIDTRTDVYALGVLLYELLTGTKPLDRTRLAAASHLEIRRAIREIEPARPAATLSAHGDTAGAVAAKRKASVETLRRELGGELGWIPLKALKKERAERYDSAAALEADVNRYLAGEPLVAGPDSLGYRARKFVRRHRAALATALVAVAIAAVTVVTYVESIRRAQRQAEAALATADEQRRIAEEACKAAERESLLARRAAAATDARYLIQQKLFPAALERATVASRLGDGQWEDGLLVNDVAAVATDQWQFVARAPCDGEPLDALIAGPNDARLLVLRTARSLSARTPSAEVKASAPAAGTCVEVGEGTDGAVIDVSGSEVIRCRPTDMTILARREFDVPVHAAAIGGGRVVVVDRRHVVTVFDDRRLEPIARLDTREHPALRGRETPRAVCVSPSGGHVLVQGNVSHAAAWTIEPEKVVPFALGNQRLAFADDDTVLAWHLADLAGGRAGFLFGFEFDAPEKRDWGLATIPADDAKSPVMIAVAEDYRSRQAFCFGSGGWAIATLERGAAAPATGRYANLLPEENGAAFELLHGTSTALVLRRDDDAYLFAPSPGRAGSDNARNFAVATTRDGMLRISKAEPEGHRTLDYEPFAAGGEPRQVQLQWPGGHEHAWALAATPDGRTVAAVVQQSEDEIDSLTAAYGAAHVVVYRPGSIAAAGPSWPAVHTFAVESGLPNPWNPRFLAIDPAGRVIVYWNGSARVTRHDVETGRPLGDVDLGVPAARSPDGALVAGVSLADGVLRVVDVATGRETFSRMGFQGTTALCLSADNRYLLVQHAASGTPTLTTIDLQSPDSPPRSLATNLEPLAWSAESDRFVAFATEAVHPYLTGSVVLADTRDGRVTAVLHRGAGRGAAASFSPTGREIALTRHRFRADVVRNLRPEDVGALLERRAATPAAIPRHAKLDLPKESVVGATPEADVLDAADTTELARMVGTAVRVRGTVRAAHWTASRNALNIELDGPDDRRVLLWISPSAYPKFEQAHGRDLDRTLREATVEARGKVSPYGGLRKDWKGFLQVAIVGPDDLVISADATETR
jgi:hypothetical protein